MSDEVKTLTAAERRERRLNRILGNSEERMKKILSGPHGGEQRLPPMLEGGEFRSVFLSGGGDDSPEANENCKDFNLSSPNSSCPSQCSIFRSVKQMDSALSLFFGFFVRILMASGIMFNVLVLWILFFFGYDIFKIAQESPKFINDVMTMLRSGNCSPLERVLRRCSAALGFIHVFTSRLLIMVSGFLIGHSALIVFRILPKDLIIPFT